MLEKILSHTIGKKKNQKYWKLLLNLSLNGMNIGTGSDVNESGEKRVLQEFVKNKSEKFILFDIGANIGNYAKLALSINSDIDIYCFEPSKKTYEFLKENLLEFNQEKLHLYNFGFGSEEGVFTLYSDQETSGLASIYKRRLDHFNINMGNEEHVMLKDIDNFCINNKIEKIDFLKIDVEGNELEVLKGASKMIHENRINAIQFEFGGCNIDSRTFFQDFYYLLCQNYDIYRILKKGLEKIDKYSELNEIFVTTNYIAINNETIRT